jgi:thiamine pyrophosphokinase
MPAEGITSRGLAYPLRNESLDLGPARGVSNVVTDENPTVELERGLLLAILTFTGSMDSAGR